MLGCEGCRPTDVDSTLNDWQLPPAGVVEHPTPPPDWYDAGCFRQGELSLQLLGREHARAWLEQTRDTATNAMARLPEFTSVQSAAAWLDERRASTRERVQLDRKQVFAFAIHSERRGFVGSLSLHRFGGDAFVSFFVGVDHRGRGLGRQALALLERAALERLDIRELFAATFASNAKARRALEAVGWQSIAQRALRADAPVVFYSRGRDATLAADPRASCQRLAALLRAIDSDLSCGRDADQGGDTPPAARASDSCR